MESNQNKKGIVSISKETLAQLEAEEFPGEKIIVDSPEKLSEAIRELNKCKMIGFDTETRPSFKKGQHYDVSLIQLSTEDACYLFRINLIGLKEELKSILENENILKIGLSIHDDFHNLRKQTELEPRNFLDLQNYVKQFNIADNSLSRIYGILFDKRISKGQRLTNWEAEELTAAQQAYASLDAYACLTIYQYLESGKFSPEESKYLVIPEEKQEKEETDEPSSIEQENENQGEKKV